MPIGGIFVFFSALKKRIRELGTKMQYVKSHGGHDVNVPPHNNHTLLLHHNSQQPYINNGNSLNNYSSPSNNNSAYNSHNESGISVSSRRTVVSSSGDTATKLNSTGGGTPMGKTIVVVCKFDQKKYRMTLKGDTIRVVTVAKIKRYLAISSGINATEQELTFNGSVLQDTDTGEAIGLFEGCILTLDKKKRLERHMVDTSQQHFSASYQHSSIATGVRGAELQQQQLQNQQNPATRSLLSNSRASPSGLNLQHQGEASETHTSYVAANYVKDSSRSRSLEPATYYLDEQNALTPPLANDLYRGSARGMIDQHRGEQHVEVMAQPRRTLSAPAPSPPQAETGHASSMASSRLSIRRTEEQRGEKQQSPTPPKPTNLMQTQHHSTAVSTMDGTAAVTDSASKYLNFGGTPPATTTGTVHHHAVQSSHNEDYSPTMVKSAEKKVIDAQQHQIGSQQQQIAALEARVEQLVQSIAVDRQQNHEQRTMLAEIRSVVMEQAREVQHKQDRNNQRGAPADQRDVVAVAPLKRTADERLAQNLKKFAESLGQTSDALNLHADNNYTCVVTVAVARDESESASNDSINNITLLLTYDPQGERLYVYTTLSNMIPPDPTLRLQLFEMLLEGALLGRDMAGGGVGISVKSNLILQSYSLNMQHVDDDALASSVGHFAESSLIWTEKLRSLLESPPSNNGVSHRYAERQWNSMSPSKHTAAVPSHSFSPGDSRSHAQAL